MSKRNTKEILDPAAENEGQDFFDLADKNHASSQHSNRFSYSAAIYENERKIEKTEENQSL